MKKWICSLFGLLDIRFELFNLQFIFGMQTDNNQKEQPEEKYIGGPVYDISTNNIGGGNMMNPLRKNQKCLTNSHGVWSN